MDLGGGVFIPPEGFVVDCHNCTLSIKGQDWGLTGTPGPSVCSLAAPSCNQTERERERAGVLLALSTDIPCPEPVCHREEGVPQIIESDSTRGCLLTPPGGRCLALPLMGTSGALVRSSEPGNGTPWLCVTERKQVSVPISPACSYQGHNASSSLAEQHGLPHPR